MSCAFYTSAWTHPGICEPALWRIFNLAEIVLWLVLAFWVGLVAAIICGCLRRFGKNHALWLVPFVWTGIERVMTGS